MAISEDTGNQPVAVHPTGTTATTASFSPQANTLLVALVAADGAATGTTSASVSDSLSGVWTLLKRQNTNVNPTLGGTTEVWCRYLSAAPGSMTVTANGWNANAGNLVVRCLLGASSTQTGATAGSGGASVAPSATLTPTQLGSWVYGAALDYTTNASLVANAQSAIIDQFNDATNGDTWGTFKGAASTSALSSTTYGATNANAAFNVAIAEILPAGAAALSDPPALDPIFLPVDSPLYGLSPWYGAPDDATHNVIVNAGVASITFLSPSTRPMMLLALTSETGPGATAITVPDPDVLLDPLFTPDDPLGGMQPWSGAPDSITTSNVSVTAGVAAVSFVAQSPSAGLTALPGTGSLTFAAQAPTAAVGALPGAAAVTLAAQAPAVALASLPGAAAVSFTAQAPTAAVGALPGAASITFTASSATASLAALPGAASIALVAQAPTASLAVLPGAAAVSFAAQNATGLAIDGTWDPSAPLFLPDDPLGGMLPWSGAVDGIITGDASVLAGVASITFAGQQPVPALGITPGTASVSVAAQSPSAALAALPATGSITLAANGPTAAVGALPGAASVALAARTSSTGLAALPGTASITLAGQQPVAGIAPTAGAAAITFTGRSALSGPGGVAGVASITFTARSASTALAVLPGTATIALTAQSASVTVVLPQVGVPTLISGQEPQGSLSGRESISSVSGSDTGPISGREPLSSTSGTEAPTTIRGRES